MLVEKLNWVGLLAPIMIFLMVLVQKWITDSAASFEGSLQGVRAERLDLVEEIVEGVKFIKFNALEKQRLEKYQKKRLSEKGFLFKIILLFRLNDAANTVILPIISLICFWVFTRFYRELSTSEVYSILTLIAGLDSPLRYFIQALEAGAKSCVSAEKMAQLLAVEKQGIQKDSANLNQGEILIKNGSFHWKNQQVEEIYTRKAVKQRKNKNNRVRQLEGNTERSPISEDLRPPFSLESEKHNILKNINLQIHKGEFVGVVGKVGSGKSSLIYAICNEIIKAAGTVEKNGSIALIPQEAFLLNDSVKNNILFGNELNKEKYEKALRLSQLKHDLKIFSSGDSTQIGERGINLSGGQRQRISIARALYSDSDIYLIDDALSALDAHVGHNVMELAFVDELKGKTRVMVTHQLNLLPKFDRILFLNSGQIACEGNFNEIKDHPDFRTFCQMKAEEEDSGTLVDLDHNVNRSPSIHKSRSMLIEKRMFKFDQVSELDLGFGVSDRQFSLRNSPNKFNMSRQSLRMNSSNRLSPLKSRISLEPIIFEFPPFKKEEEDRNNAESNFTVN